MDLDRIVSSLRVSDTPGCPSRKLAMVTIVDCTARNLGFDDPSFSARACEAPTEAGIGRVAQAGRIRFVAGILAFRLCQAAGQQRDPRYDKYRGEPFLSPHIPPRMIVAQTGLNYSPCAGLENLFNNGKRGRREKSGRMNRATELKLAGS
jgi:hypothetical protein